MLLRQIAKDIGLTVDDLLARQLGIQVIAIAASLDDDARGHFFESLRQDTFERLVLSDVAVQVITGNRDLSSQFVAGGKKCLLALPPNAATHPACAEPRVETTR